MTVGNITFESAPVGALLHRPTGELALLWQLFANSIERERKLRQKLEKAERK